MLGVWLGVKLQALVYDILLSFNSVRSVARSVIRTQTFRRALTASMDSCAEINGVPLQWRNQFWQSLEEGTVPRRRKSLTPSILPLITP